MTGKAIKKRPQASAQSLSGILPEVGRQLNLDRRIQEWSLLNLWPDIVDSCFSKSSRAVKVKCIQNQTVLVVWVRHAGTATELNFHAEDYCTRLNRYFPQTGIRLDRIDVRVAHG